MDEREWQVCDAMRTMLQFLHSRGTERKWRLFACACCRRIWDLLPVDHGRRTIEVAEQYADHRASLADLEASTPKVTSRTLLRN